MSPGSTSSGWTCAEGLGVAGVFPSGAFGDFEFFADVPRQVGVGGLPFLRLGIAVDQIAQLGGDLRLRLAVELGDIGQVNRAAMIERNQQPLLGARHVSNRRLGADHVLPHDRGFFGFSGRLVIFLQRHDQHGVGVFAELDQVGHPADGAAVLGGGEGRLVDRPVLADEAVVKAVQLTTLGLAGGFRPSLVLRLEDAAGLNEHADFGGDSACLGRSIFLEEDAAIDHGFALTVLDLMDDLVVADEQAPLGDMPQRRRGNEGGWSVPKGTPDAGGRLAGGRRSPARPPTE